MTTEAKEASYGAIAFVIFCGTVAAAMVGDLPLIAIWWLCWIMIGLFANSFMMFNEALDSGVDKNGKTNNDKNVVGSVG